MAGRLATYVSVVDDRGVTRWYGPGDDVPGWAAEQIGNPDAWADQPTHESDEAPPRSGKGSGRDEWAAYAAVHDVTVPDDASRDDVVGLLADAGVLDAD